MTVATFDILDSMEIGEQDILDRDGQILCPLTVSAQSHAPFVSELWSLNVCLRHTAGIQIEARSCLLVQHATLDLDVEPYW